MVREASLGGGRHEVVFAETPPLSSYLVAIIVGRFASTPPLSVRGVPVRTLATPEKLELCAFGQACIGATLPLLMRYFDVPYAFGKLDQIGIPDFEAGAMENAGAIAFIGLMAAGLTLCIGLSDASRLSAKHMSIERTPEGLKLKLPFPSLPDQYRLSKKETKPA